MRLAVIILALVAMILGPVSGAAAMHATAASAAADHCACRATADVEAGTASWDHRPAGDGNCGVSSGCCHPGCCTGGLSTADPTERVFTAAGKLDRPADVRASGSSVAPPLDPPRRGA